MATQWQDRYTELANINNGNEIQNGDSILGEHITYALENIQWLKERCALQTDIANLTTELNKRRIAYATINIATSRPDPQHSGSTQTIVITGGFNFPCLSTDNFSTLNDVYNHLRNHASANNDIRMAFSGRFRITDYYGDYKYCEGLQINFRLSANTIVVEWTDFNTSNNYQKQEISKSSSVTVTKISF